MNRRAIVLATAGIAVLGLGGGAFFYERARKQAAEEAALAARGQFVRADSPVIGPATAPVTIVEFFDPSCEACRAFYPYVKQILAMYPSDVRLVLRYAAFHKGSDEAVKILEVARAQNKFVAVLDALMAEQPRWAAHHAPDLARAWQIAAKAGLDLNRVEADAPADKIAAFLAQEAADVKAADVRKTPSFFVNGKPLLTFGPQPLLELVRAELETAKKR